ncbi:MAG: chromosome segregation protein SMC [Pseudomonadota bacterium]
MCDVIRACSAFARDLFGTPAAWWDLFALQITGLRLIGFKSFVEPTTLLIQPGLTGVVGPNGCGKSNLLEALRWVMGETSYKSMRASSMDDVIFSGTDHRPARNAAEVTVMLDNAERNAPAEFNSADVIEISRRIEREAGSVYRVNGKEVRARDVKVLFEDAATGARSHALVRQGQIGELITAKPEKRRRILEDAAGIAGLHTRRHEAEIKLRGADDNLARLEDLLGQLNGQINGLKRQARAAKRYREIAEEIRAVEAVLLHYGWQDVIDAVTATEALLDTSVRALAEATEHEAASQRTHFEASAALQPLRDREAERAAALQRLKIENETQQRDIERAEARGAELAGRITELRADADRNNALVDEARRKGADVEAEITALTAAEEAHRGSLGAVQAALEGANAELATRDGEADAQRTAFLEAKAAREQADARHRDATRRLEQRIARREAAEREQAAAVASAPELNAERALEERIAQHATELETQSRSLEQADEAMAAAIEQARQAQTERADSREKLTALDAEATALDLAIGTDEAATAPVSAAIAVTEGYEIALAAALGDGLDAPVDTPVAASTWRSEVSASAGAELPADATPLLDLVDAPPALHRRLQQVGVVDEADGAALQLVLAPGQLLVSRTGALWRWDGYAVRAGETSAAARRLEMRTRRRALEQERAAAAQALSETEEKERAAQATQRECSSALAEAKSRVRDLQSAISSGRDELTRLERLGRESRERIALAGAALARAGEDMTGAEEEVSLAAEALLPESDVAEKNAALDAAMQVLAVAKDAALACRTAVSEHDAERMRMTRRLDELRQACDQWRERAAQGATQSEILAARLAETEAAAAKIAEAPAAMRARQEKLRDEIERGERARTDAADALAEADTAVRSADKALDAARAAVSEHREARARGEAQLEAARERMAAHGRLIRETLDCTPQQCLDIAGITQPDLLPDRDLSTRQLERLRADRERLGGVNLRAEQELEELTVQFDGMEQERVDLEEAIGKLRQGISQLNREARRRLLDAFEMVDGHFRRLFSTLFNGGAAELRLVDSDDPLDAGLEIVARPPGKNPVTLSLLSGGEQALTATALTFAVFLTNPSPICVLDEVDAPLDDANVDRYCDLMDEMARSTSTRFLVITHHPNTMARMSRLFGVTMMEKGVSQLVSVDLETAERIRDTA